MDVHQLKVFLTVSREANFSRAAGLLSMVQSNVTARIKQLEGELGRDLFIRTPRGAVLTPAGRTLLPYAEQVVRLVAEGRRAVQELTEPKGPLPIGALESIASFRLPPVLCAYHKAHPSVEFSIVTGTTQELLVKVLDYDLHGAFLSFADEHPELLRERVWSDELVLCGHKRLSSYQEITAALRAGPMLSFKQGCAFRGAMQRLFCDEGWEIGTVLEFGTFDGLLSCAANGMGVCLVPLTVIQGFKMRDRLAWHRLPSSRGVFETMFVRRRDVPETKCVRSFLDIARKAAPEFLPA